MSVSSSPLSVPPPAAGRPLWPLLLLHLAAAAVCFAFFTVVPVVVCLVYMVFHRDTGGPLFFPVFVMGVVVFAAVVTGILSGSVLLCDLLRRRYRIVVWAPPFIVFWLAALSCRLLFRDLPPSVPFVAGAVAALGFVAHWAAISTFWFLPRWLSRRFRAPAAQRLPGAGDGNSGTLEEAG